MMQPHSPRPAAFSPALLGLFLGWIGCGGWTITAAQDWPGFHGPGGLGKTSGTLPDRWSTDDYAWRYPLGGSDVGSIAIAGERAFLLAYDSERSALTLLAIDIGQGTTLWKRPFPIAPYHRHKRNTYAASTPAVDGDRVYIASADPNHTWLRCLSLDGEELWTRDFGPWQSDHGFGTSPRVAAGLVVLYDSQQAEQLEPGQQPAHERIIAVDAATGADRWQTPLKATVTNYGVPAFYVPETGPRQVIAAGRGNGIFGIDAASGKLLWERPVLDKRSVGTPLVVGDLAIASCGSGGGGNYTVALRIPSNSDEEPQEAFRIDRAAAYVPTPAVDGEHLMIVSDNGIVTRVKLPDGQVVWSKRLGGNYGVSPIIVGNKLLTISLDGIASVIACDDEYTKLGEVDLGAGVGATPACGSGKLLLRVGDELCCLPLESAL